MRIIVITLAILMAGCSNYDSCYEKNFDAHYEAHQYYVDKYEDGEEVCNTKSELVLNPKYKGVSGSEDLYKMETRTQCYTPSDYSKPIWAKYTVEQRKFNAHQYASGQCRNID